MDIQSLIRILNPEKGVISRVNFEAFCNTSGYIEAEYISFLAGHRVTQASINSQLNRAVGAAAFIADSEDEMELLTFDEFKEIYSFGKEKSVRNYIKLAEQTHNKLLTKENLFSWVQEL